MEILTNPHANEALYLVQQCLYARNLALYRHSLLTASIARTVAKGAGIDFGCSPAQAHIAGILHDIGKIYISDEILEKRLSLTPREWEVMRRHPAWGREFVRGTLFESYGEIIANHHECQEGSYPVGLPDEEIGSSTRLIALADRMASFLDDRPYRRRITDFGMVCREVKNNVRALFPAEDADPIESALIGFAVRWFNNSFQEFDTTTSPLQRGNELRHAPCISPDSGPLGCGTGRCQLQLLSAEPKKARGGCS